MARDHRWNNLEDARLAKSAIGDGLIFGGADPRREGTALGR